MSKKKKDEFNQIPQPISKQKPGDLLSQGRKRKLLDTPGDACSVNTPGIYNLDIIKSKGRVQGESITYDADQIYNYQSQSQRYDRSINLIPAYVTESESDTVYGFCSHNSPKGFWEVALSKGGIATFINLSPRFLTILCPRPFQLDELLEIDSDSPSFLFTQTAGNRTVIIEPNNTKYPLFSIQSTCFTDTCDSGSSSPLIIRIETDNNLVFTDLVILNRAIDNWDGQGYVGMVDDDIVARKVNSVFRAPDDLQRAYLWVGGDLLVTWGSPVQDSEFITDYRAQKLLPPYQDDQTFGVPDNRLATISANIRFRIVANFSILDSQISSTSDPIFFTYPNPNNKVVFADDSLSSLGFAYISNSYNTIEFGNKIVNEIDPNNIGTGFSFISNSYVTVEFAVKLINEIDTNDLGSGFVFNSGTYTKIDLGGIIIG